MVSIATSTLAQRVFTFFFFFNFFIIIYEGDTEDTYRSLYKLIFCPKPHKATFCTPRVSKLTITADNTNGENSASDKTNCICWLGRSHAELFISQEPVWKVLRICLFVWFLLGEAPENALNKLKCPHCNYIAKHRRTLKTPDHPLGRAFLQLRHLREAVHSPRTRQETFPGKREAQVFIVGESQKNISP